MNPKSEMLSWSNLSALLNSAFMTSLVGALAGAFSGARALNGFLSDQRNVIRYERNSTR
jgi:hypothetical protein